MTLSKVHVSGTIATSPVPGDRGCRPFFSIFWPNSAEVAVAALLIGTRLDCSKGTLVRATAEKMDFG